MGNEKNNKKSIIKDIGILLCVIIPLLFIIIGGVMWRNDRFDGTLMAVLFPALFFGIISGWATLLFVSNIFKSSAILWIIFTCLIFILTVAFYLLEMKTAFIVVMAIPIGLVLLLVLINWIAGAL